MSDPFSYELARFQIAEQLDRASRPRGTRPPGRSARRSGPRARLARGLRRTADRIDSQPYGRSEQDRWQPPGRRVSTE